jgi:hypothetical protein
VSVYADWVQWTVFVLNWATVAMVGFNVALTWRLERQIRELRRKQDQLEFDLYYLKEIARVYGWDV